MTEVLVDTNVLVHSIINQEKKKHSRAVKLLEDLSSGERLAISTQNLAELSRVLLEKTTPRMNAQDTANYVSSLAKLAKIISYDEGTIVLALLITRNSKAPFFYALLAASMQENQIKEIYTENTRDFSGIPGIRAINPF